MATMRNESRQSFTFIYEHNLWEYGSGVGSLPETTLEYRYFLERFIVKNNIQTIVDFGCGDWNFSRYIYWYNAKYTGYDTVQQIIERNNKLFSTDKIKFFISPENFCNIRSAELLLCKDVLQHWDSESIQNFLESIKGKFQYILLTNSQFPATESNKDIRIGQFRPLDLRTPPFNIPAEPILAYDVRYTASNGKSYLDLKHMLLLENW